MSAHEFALFALLGLGSGAIYAAIALGLVMMHQASGVINFAHGAVAVYAIYVYSGLRVSGQLLVPLPGVPKIALGGPMPFVGAFAIAVAMSALIGAVAYLVIFRPLQGAPPLARLVATIGLLVTISALLLVQFPSESDRPQFIQTILPTDNVSIFGVVVPADRLWLTGLVLLTSFGLAALYRFSTFGLATRAAAASTKGTELVGRSPELVALGNWVLASMLAGAFGVLVSPLMSISPDAVIVLVVPALAAAVCSRFTSFVVACVAGLVLGMTEGVLVGLQTTYSWLPQQGLPTTIPLVVVIVLLFVRGRGVLGRQDLNPARLPFSPRPENVGRNTVIWVGVAIVALAVTGDALRLGLIVSMIGTLVCLSTVLLSGYLGQMSLMQITFAGLSGLLLSALAAGAGVPFPLSPLLAAGASGLLGLMIGIPALRVRGTSLAVATLAAAVATEQLLFRNSTLTGGVEGHAVPNPSIFGLNLGILGDEYPRFVFGLLVLAVVTLLAVGMANLRRSPTGLRMLAIRMNERAAASSGVNVAEAKLIGFMLAALIAGFAGTLFAYQQVRLSTASFGVLTSLVFLAWAYLGGISSITGAFIAGLLIPGGLLVTVLEEIVYVGQYQTLIGGVALTAIAVLYPDGLAGLLRNRPRLSVSVMGQFQRRRTREGGP